MKSKLLNKYITALLFSLSAIFGIIGFLIYYSNKGILFQISDLFYDVLKLYIIDSNFTSQHINISLNIARFLAPLSLATAIIKWLMKNFAHQINRQKVKMFDNHIIICGDAESNSLLIQDINENKKEDYIFVKKENPEEPSVVSDIISYQSINSDLLTDIAFYKSRYMIVSFKDDVESLYFINKLLEIIELNQIQHEIDIIILFNNPHWAELSNDIGMLKNISSKVNKNKFLNVRYLNYLDKGIRKHMLNYAPDTIKPITNISDPALAVGVIGDGILMQRLVINLALNSHYINHKKLKVYMVTNSSKEFFAFVKKYQLNNIIEIIEIEKIYDNTTISAMYICENDELKILQNIKALKESEYLSNVKRYIFIDNSRNITSLLIDKQTEVIDISKEVGVFDNIIDESLDESAKTIHNDYITKLDEANKRIADKETHQEWSILSDEIKDRNRFQMDHLGIKLRSLGCKSVPISSPEEVFEWSNDPRLEALSKAEHNRWDAYMYIKGFRYGKIKDEHKKTHPDLIPYEKLDKATKDYDRNTIKNIPALLKQLNCKAVLKNMNR